MSDPNDLLGSHIGPYEIRKHIARGGMADVFLAYETDLERKVALKVMLPALAADDQYVQRFQREAQTVARLDHPNIVHVYSIGMTDTGRPYIAMQYVEGGALRDTLSHVAQQGQLIDTRQALAIIGKMAEALQVAHEAGIVHRDIKPSNILIRPDGRPVLVDLGIAAVSGGPKLTQTGTLIGTPHYMSPEQASGKALDGRSDLYSLGVILYELLSGRRPFEGDDPLAVLHAHVYETPTPLEQLRPDLSTATHQLVQRSLQKDPAHRFQSAAEMRRAINDALKAEGGPGMLTAAGVWQPYPTGEYRLSSSKIVAEEPATAAPASAKPSRRWLLALIPVLIFLFFLGAWQIVGGMVSSSGGNTPEPTAVVAAATNADPTLPAVAGDTAAATATIAPTATFAPLPTFTPTPLPTATLTPEPSATPDRGPERVEIGRSVQNTAIEAVRFGNGQNVVMFIGGLHAGFAPATVSLAQRAVQYFSDNPDRVPQNVTLYVVLNVNPDSPYTPGELSGRLNANNVDLNRNWDCNWARDARFRNEVVPGSGGPAPLSEPETRSLANFITGQNPAAVVFWEARASDGLSTAGACAREPRVSQPLATTYGLAAGYPVADFEELTSQILNGDVTNWLDSEGIPSIAVLLPEYENIDWDNNLAGMLAVLQSHGN